MGKRIAAVMAKKIEGIDVPMRFLLLQIFILILFAMFFYI